MRALTITNTSVDLNSQRAPFLSGYTVVMQNTTAGSLVVQESVDNSTFTTLATIPANTASEVKLNARYIKVSTAANIQLYGN